MKTSRINLLLAFVLVLASVACLQENPVDGGSVAAGSTATVPPTGTMAPTATQQQRPTPTPNRVATEEYNEMASLVQSYHDAGYIDTTEGKFYRLDNYYDSWAQMDWFSMTSVGRDGKDFVMRADMKWESASKTPNPSGCGFVFRIDREGGAYLVFLTTLGDMFAGVITDFFERLALEPYGPARADGEANLTVIAQGKDIYILVDDVLIKSLKASPSKLPGDGLGYMLVSGTNKDFGTHCEFTHGLLWIIK
jgi:hypothetical protein